MECRRQQPKAKTLLLPHCALRMCHMIAGQHTRGQITEGYKQGWSDCILYIPFILKEVQTKLATYVSCMRNNNLESTTVGDKRSLQ